jgi:hypothetical protein
VATELRPLRAFSIDKARNLFKSAGVALKDARAPAEYVSPHRRFDAAYDCGLQCALVVLECSKLEVNAQNHHQVAFDFFFSTLKLKGSTTTEAKTIMLARHAMRYDAAPFNDEPTVARAIAWADRLLAETEGWLTVNEPRALK